MSEIRTLNDLKKAYPYQFTKRTYELGLTHGWFANFVTLCCGVDQLLKEWGQGTQDFTWLQVKEKMGSARYHFTLIPAFEELSDYPEKRVIIQAIVKLTGPASNATVKICACCGESGSVDNYQGFYLALCERHKAMRHAGQNLSIWLNSDDDISFSGNKSK